MNIQQTVILSFLVLQLVDGCASPQAAQLPGVQIPKGAASIDDAESPLYRIRSGDQVSIQVVELDIDTTAVVGTSGSIILHVLGEMKAAGLTKSEVGALVTARGSPFLREDSRMTVSVTVRNQMAQLVTVLGAVGNQGVFPLAGEVPIIQAIATAGGSTIESDLRHIKIFKKGRYDAPIEVDLTTNLSSGTLSAIPMVGPGDTVFIPREENVIRELSGFFRDVIFLFGILGFFQ